jgi:hypothetical protein
VSVAEGVLLRMLRAPSATNDIYPSGSPMMSATTRKSPSSTSMSGLNLTEMRSCCSPPMLKWKVWTESILASSSPICFSCGGKEDLVPMSLAAKNPDAEPGGGLMKNLTQLPPGILLMLVGLLNLTAADMKPSLVVVVNIAEPDTKVSAKFRYIHQPPIYQKTKGPKRAPFKYLL